MKISSSSSWSLYLDEVHTYAYWEKLFTPEECEKIIEIAKNKGLTQGETSGKLDIRSSKISWLYAVDNLDWVFKRITDAVLNLNNRFFQFDIYALNEGLQFTNYKEPSDKYGKHIDRRFNNIIRKLSLSIQLTNPEEYEGGELILYEDGKGTEMKKEQGTLILFTSYILHEVKPITKGERNSLVSWVTRKQFK